MCAPDEANELAETRQRNLLQWIAASRHHGCGRRSDPSTF
jgi:hypothetical protein